MSTAYSSGSGPSGLMLSRYQLIPVPPGIPGDPDDIVDDIPRRRKGEKNTLLRVPAPFPKGPFLAAYCDSDDIGNRQWFHAQVICEPRTADPLRKYPDLGGVAPLPASLSVPKPGYRGPILAVLRRKGFDISHSRAVYAWFRLLTKQDILRIQSASAASSRKSSKHKHPQMGGKPRENRARFLSPLLYEVPRREVRSARHSRFAPYMQRNSRQIFPSTQSSRTSSSGSFSSCSSRSAYY